MASPCGKGYNLRCVTSKQCTQPLICWVDNLRRRSFQNLTVTFPNDYKNITLLFFGSFNNYEAPHFYSYCGLYKLHECITYTLMSHSLVFLTILLNKTSFYILFFHHTLSHSHLGCRKCFFFLKFSSFDLSSTVWMSDNTTRKSHILTGVWSLKRHSKHISGIRNIFCFLCAVTLFWSAPFLNFTQVILKGHG